MSIDSVKPGIFTSIFSRKNKLEKSSNQNNWQWQRLPSLSDPRLAILAILLSYLILGITVLGFNRSIGHILLIISAACGLDMFYHWLFKQRQLLFPLSAAITGCSLSILTNFAHGSWLPLVPVYLAISSKYLFTVRGKHVYNPALFGITVSLLVSGGLISAAPAYQWGGSVAVIIFIITAALLLFALRIQRTTLIISFLVFYAIQLAVRAYLMQHLVPPETIIMGALSSPAFYLFTFFMITDPATSPSSRKGQIWMALIIVLIDLYLHKFESVSTFFFAGFIYFSLRLVWLKCQQLGNFIGNLLQPPNPPRKGLSVFTNGYALRQVFENRILMFRENSIVFLDDSSSKKLSIQKSIQQSRWEFSQQVKSLILSFFYLIKSFIINLISNRIDKVKKLFQSILDPLYRWSLISILAICGVVGYQQIIVASDIIATDFKFVEIAAEQAGISTHKSNILEQVDPRLQHIGKWLLSVGDAVAIADVNQDNLPDLFLTYPLKDKRDRAGLYLNQGNFQFTRVPLPALANLANHQQEEGLPSGALWWDYDNDTDADLLVTVGYGKSKLLKNQFVENCLKGKFETDKFHITFSRFNANKPNSICIPEFVDVSSDLGIDDYTISLTANALDMNRDGKLDLMIGNAMNPLLPGYDKPTYFNIFKLPESAYPDDRRMVNVMHRTWHDADNGGENLFYLNDGKKLVKQDIQQLGLDGHRWTLAIGTGDLNGDGWTDLYLANDFGPDQLYFNQKGQKFTSIRSKFVGKIGHDTYKGMNASLGDIDNNGTLDIYVSNVHEKLQAEGSLLWMNGGKLAASKAEQNPTKAFSDQAIQRHALNENRFGWGGAMGDINRDGFLDILQANGMVDNSYDRPLPDARNQRLKWKITTPHYFTNPEAINNSSSKNTSNNTSSSKNTSNNNSSTNNSSNTTKNSCADFWYWNSQIALTPPDTHGYADRWADLRDRCIFPYEQNRVYINQGKSFTDVATLVGWDKPGNSRGIALADLDNDGDLDAFVTHQFAPVSIYRNDSTPKTWLGLDLQGNGQTCNTDAIGTQVKINSELGQQLREINASNGFSSQSDRRLLFGLDNYSSENISAEIHWCGQEKSQIIELGVNQYHRIVQDD